MKTLNEDIKSGSFKPVYLLYGEERFLRRSYKARMIQAITGEDTMNLSVFEGKDTDPEAVADLAQTMPFFAEHRLIVLEETGLFKKDAGKLPDLLEQLPETTILLFSEPEEGVDKRNRLYKRVARLGYVAHLERQKPEELARWAGGFLQGQGKKITVRTMQYFLSLTGDDMERIRTELEKLVSYLGNRSVVEQEDVDAITSRQVEDRIFDMITLSSSGRRQEAFRLYYDLLSLKEAPLKILTLFTRQYNLLLQTKELLSAGKGQGEIASLVGVPPFAAKRLCGQAGAFSPEELRERVKSCISAEEAVKSGRMNDQVAVEMLMTEMGEKTGKNGRG